MQKKEINKQLRKVFSMEISSWRSVFTHEVVRFEEGYYPSTDGVSQIHYCKWIPTGSIRAIVQITHGMSEHILRYSYFAEYLVGHGFMVVGHDHLGHGSSSKPENYGYFAKENPNLAVMSDIYSLTRITKRDYPNLPYFLFGHSMGSFFARQYCAFYGNELSGAIFCGTGGQSPAVAWLGKMLSKLIGVFKGDHYRSQLIDDLAHVNFNKRIHSLRTRADWLSADKQNIDVYLKDEKTGFVFTVNGYVGLMDAVRKANSMSYVRKMPKSLPVLFIAGESDPVGEYGRGVNRAVMRCHRAGMYSISVKLYPELRHEILNERNAAVYRHVADWLDMQLEEDEED